MNKKIIIIISIIALVGVFILFFIYNRETSNPKSTSNKSQSIETLKAAEKLYIPVKNQTETIPVLNFYKNAVSASDEVVQIKTDETKNYQIFYNPKNDAFWVPISNIITFEEFSNQRVQIENDILTILGATKDDACVLNIKLGVPGQLVDEKLQDKEFPLSFCNS